MAGLSEIIADRQKIQKILTLDHRHFSLIRSQTFEAFDLLP